MKSLFLLLFSFTAVFAQKASLTHAAMKQDIDYLNKYLKKWHPAYYDYTKKTEMEAFYTDAKQKIDSSLSSREFTNIIKTLVSQVGCGHIGVYGNKKQKSLDSLLSIPFDVNVLGNSLFVRNYFGNDSALAIGDEILSINAFKTDSLLKYLQNFKTSDGFNITHKRYAIEYAFFIFNYFAFGVKESYQIVKKNAIGTIENLDVKAIKRSTNYKMYRRNTIDSSQIVIKGKNINLQKTTISPKTFLLDLNAFSGPHLRKSYRQIFSYLRKKDAENLIIDLRDNGGGNVFGGFNFMKYLIKQPVQFVNLSRKPNLTIVNPNFKAGFFERITPLFFMLNPLQYPNKNGWNHTFLFVRHFQNFYKNNIYVITNGQSFSMTAITATKLKNKTHAIFVGEETGGSSYANRGMAGGKIVLPNSKLEVVFNVYQLKYGNGKDDGLGVLPDHEIKYTFEERNTKKDLEIEKIRELINQKSDSNKIVKKSI
jgi:hypothetical protein